MSSNLFLRDRPDPARIYPGCGDCAYYVLPVCSLGAWVLCREIRLSSFPSTHQFNGVSQYQKRSHEPHDHLVQPKLHRFIPADSISKLLESLPKAYPGGEVNRWPTDSSSPPRINLAVHELSTLNKSSRSQGSWRGLSSYCTCISALGWGVGLISMMQAMKRKLLQDVTYLDLIFEMEEERRRSLQ